MINCPSFHESNEKLGSYQLVFEIKLDIIKQTREASFVDMREGTTVHLCYINVYIGILQ